MLFFVNFDYISVTRMALCTCGFALMVGLKSCIHVYVYVCMYVCMYAMHVCIIIT